MTGFAPNVDEKILDTWEIAPIASQNGQMEPRIRYGLEIPTVAINTAIELLKTAGCRRFSWTYGGGKAIFWMDAPVYDTEIENKSPITRLYEVARGVSNKFDVEVYVTKHPIEVDKIQPRTKSPSKNPPKVK